MLRLYVQALWRARPSAMPGVQPTTIPRTLAVNKTRTFATVSNPPKEDEIQAMIAEELPGADITVTDMSGGCGTFFQVRVVAEEFKGKPMVRQHQQLNKILKPAIPLMHGIRYETAAPE
eukprot:TRINITY_DN10442_c0_g1_i1.p2 TRINITY_DN10442_c0_g1~~TRINITY_DN10442_c0_g1_i1.p2  ORF type:complete len:119 (-),score=26.52 TRINITY_DN10442_c0_g1_i1:118-474(-)